MASGSLLCSMTCWRLWRRDSTVAETSCGLRFGGSSGILPSAACRMTSARFAGVASCGQCSLIAWEIFAPLVARRLVNLFQSYLKSRNHWVVVGREVRRCVAFNVTNAVLPALLRQNIIQHFVRPPPERRAPLCPWRPVGGEFFRWLGEKCVHGQTARGDAVGDE
eukprot:9396687-Pyramimonas_sp.AAC.1